MISNDESAAFKEREADLLSVSEDTDEDRDRDNDRDPDRQSQHSRADSGMEPSREPSEAGDADDDGTVAGADVAGDHVRKITTRFPGGRAAAFLANYPSNRSLQHRASAPYGKATSTPVWAISTGFPALCHPHTRCVTCPIHILLTCLMLIGACDPMS